jgi:asparagine synthase (glutamine-hydrolysing)
VTAILQSQSKSPVKTFTIALVGGGFNEAPYAAEVAQHLGTDHHVLEVSSRTAREVIPMLPWMYDEPFGDSSQIPTYLVCSAARQHVTVALSGDGGDELFGGYNRYFWGPRLWSVLGKIPGRIRQLIGAILQALPIEAVNYLGSCLLRQNSGVVLLGDKLQKLGERLQYVHSLEDLYFSLVTEWTDLSKIIVGASAIPPLDSTNFVDCYLPAEYMRQPLPMMYNDSVTYLPDDILCKVDRAAMATSLETRVPFLDHRVVELAWRLPLEMKVNGNVGKCILREMLACYVPQKMIDRPKAGFSIPIGQWLRGPLRGWAEGLLSEQRLEDGGYFKADSIRRVWADHLSGRRDQTAKLWTVLMFQAWLEYNC